MAVSGTSGNEPWSARVSRRVFMQGTAVAAATVATSSLAACTGGDDKGGGSSAKAKPIKGGPKTTKNTEVIYPEGYVGPIASHKGPITTERATLTVVVHEDARVGDWAKNEFTAWYEKRTNVHVDFKTVAGGSPAQRMTKVNAMISSGDLPDVFLGMNFTPSQLLLYGRDQQLFVPLNDIIDQYCPETQKIYADYPDAKKMYTSPDGKIYSLPNIRDTFHARARQDRVWIYKPWLDELGLQMPQTLDEFEEVLTAFKTKDPNRNGKHDEIPFTMAKAANGRPNTFDMFIMGSFMYNPGTPWLVLDDGKVDVVFNKPGWREGLKYLNRLYSKGLIPKTAFTQTSEQLIRKGNAKDPVLGAVRQHDWSNFMDIDYEGPHPRWTEYVCVPILKGPDASPTAAWDYYYPYHFGSFVVTKGSKIPEIAAMWGDGLYELETTLRAGRGVLGTNWRWARKGEKGMDGRQAVWNELTVWPAPAGMSWAEVGPEYYSNDIRVGVASNPKNPTLEPLLYDNIKRAYYPDRQPQAKEIPPNLAMSQQDAGLVADIQTTLNNYVLQTMTKFAMGDPDPNDDKAWDSYLGTLKNMKLQQYLDVYQRAYDSSPK